MIMTGVLRMSILEEMIPTPCQSEEMNGTVQPSYVET